jgi:hypothetical protein
MDAGTHQLKPLNDRLGQVVVVHRHCRHMVA